MVRKMLVVLLGVILGASLYWQIGLDDRGVSATQVHVMYHTDRNLGVVWAEGGDVLNVLYVEGGQPYVRIWSLTGKGLLTEVETFPVSSLLDFYNSAYAVGREAHLIDGSIQVRIDLGKGTILTQGLYGLVKG